MARDDVHRGEGLDLARRALILVATSLLAAPSPAQELRNRWHFVFTEPPKFEYSVLFTRSASGDTTRLLLEAPGGRYELVSSQDPSDRDSTESIRALPGRETLTRRLVPSGTYKVPGCAAVQSPDACVVLIGPNGTLISGFAAFTGKGAPALRARAEALVTPALKDRLLALSPLVPSSAELDRYGSDFLGLLWPGRFVERQTTPRRAAPERGCAFDASFGYPCSAAEERRDAARNARR